MSQICFIRVEVKKRELISRTDLAIEVARRGIPVVLGECFNPNNLLKLGSTKSYFFGKCAQPSTLEHFKCLFENGWTFGALDEEGLLPDSLNSFAEQRFSLESADICKDVFFGNKQKNTFDNIYGTENLFLFVVTLGRICGKDCYGLYDQTIQDIKKNFGEYFLLPLNFGYYTNSSLNTCLQQDISGLLIKD